jgi:hypothetical protein
MSNATDMLTAYQDAEHKVLLGQAVRFGDRQLTRADLAEIRAGRREWEAKVANEVAVASGRSSGIAVADFSGCN